MSRFLASKIDLNKDNLKVEKHDVGIIKDQKEDEYLVFFIRQGKEAWLSKNDIELISIEKTGDAYPKKICNVCHKLLDSTHFDKNQNAKNNRSVRRPSCRDCRIIIDGESLKSSERKKWQKVKPHLEPFECPICKKRTIPGLTSKVVLDHDHDSGNARMWICDSCNTGLGRFKDDTDLLKRAISYLQKELD